jgi:hypothetical protein
MAALLKETQGAPRFEMMVCFVSPIPLLQQGGRACRLIREATQVRKNPLAEPHLI